MIEHDLEVIKKQSSEALLIAKENAQKLDQIIATQTAKQNTKKIDTQAISQFMEVLLPIVTGVVFGVILLLLILR